MKKISKILIITLANLLISSSIFAQIPEKMSYQAVIRNASDNLVTSTNVGMQISILQSSAGGTAVYVERHFPTTNTNGLVSLEIGTGTIITGDFATIDWKNDIYFIKTETDLNGGASYTITGISQLLSVPYALHAKTAETITGGITETDPVYTASQANNITSTDITNLSNLSGTNTGDQDISGIATNTQAIQDTASQIRADIPDVSGFLTTETDPVYTASQANNITSTDITNLSNLSGTNTGDQDISGIATNTQAIQDTASQIRADIPDVSGFLTTETDPVYTASQANNITSTDITNLSNLSGTNTGDQDGSETKVTAGTNVTVTGAGTTASPYVVNATSLTIGDNYQGGKIFWLDATGQHGLIAATSDQNGIQWYNGTYRYTGTTGDGLYAGAMNTAMIVATQMADNQTGNFAAKVCVDYSVTVGDVTYGDWYLPSKYELNLLYQQKTSVGGFTSTYYWSSSEVSNYHAWRQYFGTGGQGPYGKNGTSYVRAVRAF